jgi:hypothetical protein
MFVHEVEENVLDIYSFNKLVETFYPGFVMPDNYRGDTALGIYPLTTPTPPVISSPFKKLAQLPVKQGNAYVLTYSEIDMTTEEIENIIIKEWVNVKLNRDRLLIATDWVVTKNVETGTPVPTEWVTYRQALRDVTDQTDPFNITWPIPPV